MGGLSRFCFTTKSCTPALSHVCTSSSAAASEIAIGFSVSTWRPGARGDHPVLRMQPGRRADRHEIARHRGEHLVQRAEGGHALLRADGLRPREIDVRHGDELEPVDALDRLEVIAADPPAPDERDAHGPARRSTVLIAVLRCARMPSPSGS